MAKNELATTNNSLPAYLQGQTKTTKFGNTDRSDIIIPRVKLLQMISPEVEEFDNAKAGHFWHTVAGESLGNEVRIVPVLLRKTYVLWAPRTDDRGILARASDGVHWDTPGLEFTVKPKNSPKEVTYQLGDVVSDTIGLGKFGTSIPEDPNSPPAASLTYDMLFLFPDHLDLGAAIVLNTRSAVKPAKDLISKVDMRQVDHFAQQYTMTTVKQKSDDGDFYNYKYVAAGYADEDVYNKAKEMYEYYSANSFRSNDEGDDADKGANSGGGAPKAAGNASRTDI